MNRLDQHQPLTTTITRFYEGDTISQVFYSNRNDLNTASICARNPDRALTPMTFKLMDGVTIVRTLEFSGGNIDNEDCTKFKFDKIADSKHKTYTATISSPPVDKKLRSPAAFGIEMHDGIMHYKAFYYQGLSEVVSESLAQIPPRLVSDPIFSILWGSLITFVIICLRK